VTRRWQIAPAAGEHESHGSAGREVKPINQAPAATWSLSVLVVKTGIFRSAVHGVPVALLHGVHGYVQYRRDSIDLAQSRAGTEQLRIATPDPAY
jgi:hypothetical protein